LFFEEGGAVGAGEFEAAIDHAEIGVLDGSVLEGASAKFGAFGGAAFGEKFVAEGGVEPGFRGEIESISQDEPLGVALTDDGRRMPDWRIFSPAGAVA